MSYTDESYESHLGTPPGSETSRRYDYIARQISQREQEAAASMAALTLHAREVREERQYNQNKFLANWIDGRVQGSSRACQMVIMTFNPANKDYFNEWKAKKLITEEELDKVTPPLNFFPLFSVVVGQTKNLWKGPVLGRGLGWRDPSCYKGFLRKS